MTEEIGAWVHYVKIDGVKDPMGRDVWIVDISEGRPPMDLLSQLLVPYPQPQLTVSDMREAVKIADELQERHDERIEEYRRLLKLFEAVLQDINAGTYLGPMGEEDLNQLYTQVTIALE